MSSPTTDLQLPEGARDRYVNLDSDRGDLIRQTKGRIDFLEAVGGVKDLQLYQAALAALTTPPAPDEAVEAAVETENKTITGMLTLSPSEIRLRCGEMTAQEMRTVQAVLGWARAAIRARSRRDVGGGV